MEGAGLVGLGAWNQGEGGVSGKPGGAESDPDSGLGRPRLRQTPERGSSGCDLEVLDGEPGKDGIQTRIFGGVVGGVCWRPHHTPNLDTPQST